MLSDLSGRQEDYLRYLPILTVLNISPRAREFFVGPTICYAYMQSIGMVNDHLTSCFRWQEIVDEYGE